MPEWRTISIRQELIKEIEKALETGRYRSVSEFVSEAIRLRLEELMRVEGISATKREQLLAIPEQLLYTPKHTWAQITPEGNIRVGISDYAQRHLKGIAQVIVDNVGKEVAQMEPFGVAETWMFMFDLYAPVSGKIVKVNEKLKEKPQLINEDPYNEGWIVEIKPKNSITLEEELKKLLSSREYNKWVNKLEGRFR
ncbi:MAG: glycine cleavage system protein GcvH [Candidatus Bathyarchaeota archaeon]|nr:glycine cleavage system protein GcvH [Candidatus Bathyarchaeota archaeon]MCX8177619.1 glycine cleavage system protein GcvH [Candidatus Bathyarchaeota archaeon]MDW8193876.1 glycine cleavage system protein GcvH [Nitrososphaerota archaeon]